MKDVLTIAQIDALARTDEAAARDQLARRLARRQDEAGGHDEEARLAELLGMATAALRAWQLALRDTPGDPTVLRALATLHQERGDHARAAACLAKLGETEPAAERDHEAEAPGPLDATDADLVRLAHRLSGREGVHARMFHDAQRGSGYTPVHRPLTADVMRAHLEGKVTVGTYVVRVDDSASFLVFDLDATRAALDRALGDATRTRDLRAAIALAGLSLRDGLRHAGLSPVLVDSGYKGRHLWCFLDRAVPAAQARALGLSLATRLRPADPRLTIEVFPKQGTVAAGGLGNLVKLPLGVHLETGRRAAVLDEQGQPADDPVSALLRAPETPLPALAEVPPPPPPAPAEGPEPPSTQPVTAQNWTDADFHDGTQVATVLEGCAVLRAVVEQVLERKHIERDELVALTYSLGHLAQGVDAVNYLLDQLPEVPEGARPGGRHKGSPIGCGRIRRRLARVVERVDCSCVFEERAGDHAHPLRHLDAQADFDRPTRQDPGDVLLAWARHLDHLRRVQSEGEVLRRAAVAALRGIPGGRWAMDEGEWRLEQDEGLPVLRWVPEA